MLLEGGLILKYKTYTIKSEEDELESCKELILKSLFGIQAEEKNKSAAVLLTLTKPILLSAAGSIGSKLLQGVSKKTLVVLKRDIDEDLEDKDIPRNNILMRRLPIPKRNTLPNRRTFHAKYAMVWRGNLPPNVQIARTYVQEIGQRRQRERQ